jgi:hypothetical protein
MSPVSGGDDGPLGFGDDPQETSSTEGDAPARRPSGAAERLAAADADDPGPGPQARTRPSGMPKGSSRYVWFVGVVLVLITAVVTLSSIGDDGISATGLEIGAPAPPFAAPVAASDLEGDVNVATGRGQGEAGNVPACEVRGEDVVNLCEQYADRPVVLVFFATRGGSCIRAVDRIEGLRRRHPDVGFVAISIRGDRGEVRDLVRERRWRFPVAYDRDGVLANLYGVVVCPQYALIARGGRAADTVLGDASRTELDRRIGALARGEVPRTPSTGSTP